MVLSEAKKTVSVLVVLFLQANFSPAGFCVMMDDCVPFCVSYYLVKLPRTLLGFSNSFQLALHLFSSDLAVLPFSVKWALYGLPLPQPIKTLKLGFEEPCSCFQEHNSATFH